MNNNKTDQMKAEALKAAGWNETALKGWWACSGKCFSLSVAFNSLTPQLGKPGKGVWQSTDGRQ